MSAVNAFADYKYEGNQLPMEEIKVLHLAIGTQIPAIRNATIKIFTPGLVENKEKIEHIQPVTETYGPHYRHVLDIYQAKNNDVGPILVFLYGGGMIRGDRILADTGKGLIYWNLGTFFASRGITTIIPDYRRVKSPSGSDGAVCLPILRSRLDTYIKSTRSFQLAEKTFLSSSSGSKRLAFSGTTSEKYTFLGTRLVLYMPPHFYSIPVSCSKDKATSIQTRDIYKVQENMSLAVAVYLCKVLCCK